MNRVGTLGHSQFLIQEMLRNQYKVAVDEQQVASGHRASDYRGLARDAATLLGTKAIAARTQEYIKQNRELSLRLEIYNTSVQGVADSAQQLREEVLKAVGQQTGVGLREQLNNAFSQIVELLNRQFDGKYIFGGSRTDVRPVDLNAPADLIALGSAAQAFQNNQIKAAARIDDNNSITYGMLADEVGGDIMTVLKNILDYDNATPFGQTLTAADETFLTSQITLLANAAADLNDLVAGNGVNMKQVENTSGRQEQELTSLKIFISDIEDVDVADAVSRLNQDQIALQVSYKVLGTLQKLTLTDYI